MRQREVVRNRLLRRADWRFLLPNPEPRRTICFADDALAAAVKQVSTQTIDARYSTWMPGECNLAVLNNPIQADLTAAWAALCPGGSCYSEWYLPRAITPRGVRRRLEAAGFSDITCYWAWPSPSRAPALFWLPLEKPGVRRFFFATRVQGPGFVRSFLQRAMRTAWRYCLDLGISVPICATARKPLGAERERSSANTLQRGMPPPADLTSTLREGWSSWGLGPTPATISMLLLTGGPRSSSKTVGLLFADRESCPHIALKLSRVPESVPGLLREAATLEMLGSLLPCLRGIPRVLFTREDLGVTAIAQTALTGTPIWSLLNRRKFRHFALQGTNWLATLAGHAKQVPKSEWWDRLVEPVLVDFEASFGSNLESGVLAQIERTLATLGSMPLICEHRDFSPWNVFVDARGELLVFDWESSEPRGLPTTDLIYFLAHLAFCVDNAMDSHCIVGSYRAALTPSTLTGAVVHECLSRYLSSTGLDASTLPSLRLLVWLRCSSFELQRLAADAGRPCTPEELRRSIFLALINEELRLCTAGGAGNRDMLASEGH
jgi:Phosphotransferase enzyme family